MSQFYALMRDESVKLIPIKEEIVEEVKEKFTKSAIELKPNGIDEVPFTGDFQVRDGENISYVDFALPETFKNIPNNQADISDFNIETDFPKSIFWYDDGKFIFQVFTKRNLLRQKTILGFTTDNKFAKLESDAFIVDNKVQAIYDNSRLYFRNYTSANMIFSLTNFVIAATNEEIENFGSNTFLDIDVDRMKNIGNIKTRRLVKVLSSTDNITLFMNLGKRKRIKLLNEYHIDTKINDEGKLIVPTNNVAKLNMVLEFLNEDIFRGAITNNIYSSNSKKRTSKS